MADAKRPEGKVVGLPPEAPTESQPPVWLDYLRGRPGLVTPALVASIAVGLIGAGALVYFGWFWWLVPLLEWGFRPFSWRAIFAGVGGFYLALSPLILAIGVWRGWITPILRLSAHRTREETSLERKLRASQKQRTRLGLLVFGLIPVIAALVSLSLIAGGAGLPTLRWIFLIVAILFPATLYYLFNVSRRYSILTDLVSNLNRIGLLTPAPNRQQEQTRQQRVLTYVRKYESTYGSLATPELEQLKGAAKLVRTPEPAEQSGEMPNPLSGVLGETRIPVLIATVLITLGWCLALPPLESAGREPAPVEALPAPEAARQGGIDWQQQFTPTLGVIPFTFLGAYFFSLQMLFRRYVRRDLSSSAFTSVSLRILLAVIGTWILIQAVDSLTPEAKAPLSRDTRLVLAFSIGMLPMIVIQGLAEIAKKSFAWAGVMESLRTRHPLSQLDGMSVWHASRLDEEDLDSVPALATADIMELMIRTRFPSDRIVEWVDQAILYAQLSDAQRDGSALTDKLKVSGIRTATGLLVVQDQDPHPLEKLFSSEERARLALAGRAIRTKPNLDLILRWRNLDADRFPALGPVQPELPMAPAKPPAGPRPAPAPAQAPPGH